MTQFLRLLADTDKALALSDACGRLRAGQPDDRYFEVEPDAFNVLPGRPFAYWATPGVRQAFLDLSPLGGDRRTAQHGGSTKDDFRFLRLWWEHWSTSSSSRWFPFAKGGAYSPLYADVYLLVNWKDDARELEADLLRKYPYLGDTANWVLHRECKYFEPGLTWPRRTKSRLSMRVLPAGCIFADKGPAIFIDGSNAVDLLSLLAVCASDAFHMLVEVQLAAADARPGGAAHSFEVGIIETTPVPPFRDPLRQKLADLARRAWSVKRTLDTAHETSHAFLLPAALRPRLGDYTPESMQGELGRIQTEIESLAFDLYGFGEADRQAPAHAVAEATLGSATADDDADEDSADDGAADDREDLLAWAVGVAFGHFDWRFATGERPLPPEPDPFEPLPARSPGMLPEGAQPFHANGGMLVDDSGHPHDLVRIAEEVLARVGVAVPQDMRRWLQREFFPFHLRRYSKSRRKAPIYWPLSTTSGSYALWLYYPSLTSQTLYTAVNDFVEPKLKQVSEQVTALRNKGSVRTRDEEKQFESLQAFNLELIELRDALLKLAPTYKPNADDGVQISAAPLWPLFRHKPWQKLLKETWAKLEKGEYDWAHLAMNYWPERVREKCKTDKSLAIAHGLEDLYVAPEAAPKKTRGRKKAKGDE